MRRSAVGHRVFLRPLARQDLMRLVDWRNDPRIAAGFFNAKPLARAGQAAWFARMKRDATRHLFVICLKSTGEAVGTVGLDHIDPMNRSAEYGEILIGDPRWLGQGFASEATGLVIRHAFRRLKLRRLYLFCFAANRQAIRLYRRHGFRPEGVMREAHFKNGKWHDVAVMGLLRREYAKRRR